MSDLETALRDAREASYVRLQGGFPVLLAGATYWAGLAAAGYLLELRFWFPIALFGSGTIFPLAVMYGAIFGNNFLKDRSPVTSVLLPAFIAMLLFWPMAIGALWTAKDLFPLILAVGLSLHFPVIGWSYNRTWLYMNHALIRAVAVFMVWWLVPEGRYTLLPLVVVAAYLITAAIVIVDSGRAKAKVDFFDRRHFADHAVERGFIKLALGIGRLGLVFLAVQVAHDFRDGDQITGIDLGFVFLGAAAPHGALDLGLALQGLQRVLQDIVTGERAHPRIGRLGGRHAQGHFVLLEGDDRQSASLPR
jgi:hypothetical protein